MDRERREGGREGGGRSEERERGRERERERESESEREREREREREWEREKGGIRNDKEGNRRRERRGYAGGIRENDHRNNTAELELVLRPHGTRAAWYSDRMVLGPHGTRAAWYSAQATTIVRADIHVRTHGVSVYNNGEIYNYWSGCKSIRGDRITSLLSADTGQSEIAESAADGRCQKVVHRLPVSRLIALHCGPDSTGQRLEWADAGLERLEAHTPD